MYFDAFNRSINFALLGSVSLFFLAKSIGGSALGTGWVSRGLFLVTVWFAIAGIFSGMRATRDLKKWYAWLAPFINALLLMAVVAFVLLLFR